MNEMNDAHAYEMQCNYGSQTPEVLQRERLGEGEKIKVEYGVWVLWI
jgi:hypothetical protein